MKASLFGAACIALLVAVFAREAILAPPPPARATTLADAERAEIYATVAMRLAMPDDTVGGSLQPTRIVVSRALLPDCPYDDEEDRLQRWRASRHPARHDCRRGDAGTISAPVEAALAAALARPGRTLIFVDDGFRVPRDPVGGRIEGGGVLLTLHAIVMPEAGTLAADGMIYIANEAAAGKRYLFRRVDGHWVLARTVPGWLS